MFAIGNEELEELPPIPKIVDCPVCDKRHRVTYGTNVETGEICKILGFVKCKKETYLVSVNGKKL